MSGHHHHSPDLHEPQDVTRQTITKRVALTGMGVNLFLTIAQLLGGLWAHSQALIADAIHTLSDLIGDIVVLFASHHAAKDADEELEKMQNQRFKDSLDKQWQNTKDIEKYAKQCDSRPLHRKGSLNRVGMDENVIRKLVIRTL